MEKVTCLNTLYPPPLMFLSSLSPRVQTNSPLDLIKVDYVDGEEGQDRTG